MRSIVDGTTAAMGVEVCSFYLADHERTRLTLAATNGLDRTQVGKVSLGWGQGITGRVAATRTPIAVEDVTRDERFSWVRGFDIEGLDRDAVGAARLARRRWSGCSTSRPATRASSTTGEIAFLQTIAALLAGIVEKGRLTAEVEARLAQLTALDAARAELLSVVTHELRTPLSVVRVYVDLLGEAADASATADADAAEWRGTPPIEQLGRLDRLVDSILASVRGEGLTGLSRAPFDAVDGGRRDGRDAAAPAPAAPDPLGSADRADDRGRRRDALPPGARAAARERIEVRAVGRGREHRRSGGSATRSRSTSPTTARASRSRTGRACSSRSSGSRGAAGAAARGSACSPPAG